MGRLLLDVEEREAVALEDPLHREQRQIGEMLVVDRVELNLANEVQQVRELDGEHAVAA